MSPPGATPENVNNRFVNLYETYDELEDRRNNLEPITTGDDSMDDEEYSGETGDES